MHTRTAALAALLALLGCAGASDGPTGPAANAEALEALQASLDEAMDRIEELEAGGGAGVVLLDQDCDEEPSARVPFEVDTDDPAPALTLWVLLGDAWWTSSSWSYANGEILARCLVEGGTRGSRMRLVAGKVR